MTAADNPIHHLGDFQLTMLSDGTYFLDAGSLFGVVPKTLWSKKVQPDANNLFAVGTNCVLIRTGKHTVLVETGIGSKINPKLKNIYGNKELLLDQFQKIGVKPDEVDIVINSHLHFDHCGWNTYYQNGVAVPTFPNAKYYAQRCEWEHGCKQLERDRISYLSDNYDPLIKSGQMELLSGDREIVPGISVKVFPGHTEHMQAVIIKSGGQTACYISDLIPTSAHIDLTWGMAFDLFPLETIESKKRYYAQAIPEKWLTMFTHDPNVPWAYIEQDERRKLVARAVS